MINLRYPFRAEGGGRLEMGSTAALAPFLPGGKRQTWVSAKSWPAVPVGGNQSLDITVCVAPSPLHALSLCSIHFSAFSACLSTASRSLGMIRRMLCGRMGSIP